MKLNDEDLVNKICDELGQNSLLVQGPGGNISWKDGNILYIKKSGSWLANSLTENIFIKVDLADLNAKIEIGNFADKPKLLAGEVGSPSIETYMHAMIPNKYIIHLHMIEMMPLLLLKRNRQSTNKILGNDNYLTINYKMPGEDLSREIFNSIKKINISNIKYILLKNHGVVFFGNNILDLRNLIYELSNKIKNYHKHKPIFNINLKNEKIDGYEAIDCKKIQSLVYDEKLINYIKKIWAICPEHIIFLGPHINFYEDIDQFNSVKNKPNLIFIKKNGVYYKGLLSLAILNQLEFYYETLIRISNVNDMEEINKIEIDKLLKCELEKNRIAINIQ